MKSMKLFNCFLIITKPFFICCDFGEEVRRDKFSLLVSRVLVASRNKLKKLPKLGTLCIIVKISHTTILRYCEKMGTTKKGAQFGLLSSKF